MKIHLDLLIKESKEIINAFFYRIIGKFVFYSVIDAVADLARPDV